MSAPVERAADEPADQRPGSRGRASPSSGKQRLISRMPRSSQEVGRVLLGVRGRSRGRTASPRARATGRAARRASRRRGPRAGCAGRPPRRRARGACGGPATQPITGPWTASEPSDRESVLEPLVGLEGAVGEQPVVADRDACSSTICAISTIGITVGYHRLLTHRAFATHKWLEYAYAIAGSLAVEGPVIGWVSDHRKHHAHADEEGDPHSPHVDHHGETPGPLRGLWHSHVGWLFNHSTAAFAEKYSPDLLEDPRHAPHRPAVPAVGDDRPGRARRDRLAASAAPSPPRSRPSSGPGSSGSSWSTT